MSPYTGRSRNSNENPTFNRRHAQIDKHLKVRKTAAKEYALNVSRIDERFNEFDHSKAREKAEEKKKFYEKAKKRKLLESKTIRKRKWKKFSRMTPEEKKERIAYLWQKCRLFMKQLKFVKQTQLDIDQ